MSNHILTRTLLALLLSTAALFLINCGDSGGSGSCDPALDENCVCETEAGQACDDPDDLDCFCFTDTDNGGANGDNNGASDRTTVTLFDNAYSPQSITINVGGQVTWVNNDTVQHTVTFSDGSIDELLNPGASFTATFESAGTFTYTDRLHEGPGLTGTVIVQ